MNESRRAARTDDSIGQIDVYFFNAIGHGGKHRVRPDIASARRLVAHYWPFNNTRVSAYQVTRVEDGSTYSTPADLTIDGAYRFCPCLGDEATCTRTED